MNVGSLFSGIGGFDLGLERAGMHINWQVENNEFCNRVLAKHWSAVPRYGDIKTINWQEVEPVDLVCGGFPCQPFSLAGKRRGKDDDRYLWPEVVRCLDTLRPTWFIGENVPGIINLALDQVCADLDGLGYQVWPVCVPACAVDAPHQRQRIWIIAHTTEWWRCPADESFRTGSRGEIGDNATISNPLTFGQQEQRQSITDDSRRELARVRTKHGARWPSEPVIQRVAHGVPARVDRLKGLGNAVVPQVVEALGRMIVEVERTKRIEVNE